MTMKNKHLTLLIVLLTTLITIIYFPSLTVPFYLDDHSSIVDNTILHTGSAAQVLESSGRRFVTYISLWLDLKFNDDVKQFHITNLVIHLLAGLFSYLLSTKLIGKAYPHLSESKISYISLFAAVLFVIHPLQTQAVTYIIQRTASLAALFYLASLFFYMCFRSSNSTLQKASYFSLCFSSTLLALFTKENTYSLLIAFILVEFALFNSLNIKRTLLGSLLVISSIIVLGLFSTEFQGALQAVDRLTREDLMTSRIDYFLAQLSILWLYVLKFIAPFNLRLEYDYTINSFSLLLTSISAILHFAFIIFAILNCKKKPLISFLIFLFYTTHSIESSFIPIKDLIFEHRTYLPNYSLCLLLSLLLFSLCSIPKYKTTTIGFLVILTIFLSFLTYKRNIQWQNPITFYKNELTYSPKSCRVLGNLAYEYQKLGDIARSTNTLEKCLHNSSNQSLNPQLVINYISLLISQKQLLKAEAIAIQWLDKVSDVPFIKIDLLDSLADIKLQMNDLTMSEQYLRESIRIVPNQSRSLISLSLVLAKQGRFSEAREYVIQGLAIEPNNELGKLIAQRLGVEN